MRGPKACTKCGVSRTVLLEGVKIRQQGIGKAGPHSQNKALYFTIVTLDRVCVPCFLKAISFGVKWETIPAEFKEAVNIEEAEEQPKGAETRVLTREEVRQGKKLTRAEVRQCEERHGKHKFCYQCGSADLEPVDDQHLHPGFCGCRNCGSSDLDGG